MYSTNRAGSLSGSSASGRLSESSAVSPGSMSHQYDRPYPGAGLSGTHMSTYPPVNASRLAYAGAASRTSTERAHAGSVGSIGGFPNIPTATKDNGFLGFCKGAWKAQNSDRNGAMEKRSEAQGWSHSAGKSTTLQAHLKCKHGKCSFRSSLVSPDVSRIWDKVISYPTKGLKIRWRFLAKSHVTQKSSATHQYSFKCLICVYMGKAAAAGIYVGTDTYLEHISCDHRTQDFHDVLLYKIGCIQGRVAEDSEEFDINLWPVSTQPRYSEPEQYLPDALLGDPTLHPHHRPAPHGTVSNQAWTSYGNDGFQAAHHANNKKMPYLQGASAADVPVNPYARRDSGQSRSRGYSSTSNTSYQQTRASMDDQQARALASNLSAISQACSDGKAVVDQLKASPAVNYIPFVNELEHALRDSAWQIQREWCRGIEQFGAVYDFGDHLVGNAMTQIIARLQQTVVEPLRRAIYSGQEINLGYLAGQVDVCRQQATAALHQYEKRLELPRPPFMTDAMGSSMPVVAMQQSHYPQRETLRTQQQVLQMRAGSLSQRTGRPAYEQEQQWVDVDSLTMSLQKDLRLHTITNHYTQEPNNTLYLGVAELDAEGLQGTSH